MTRGDTAAGRADVAVPQRLDRVCLSGQRGGDLVPQLRGRDDSEGVTGDDLPQRGHRRVATGDARQREVEAGRLVVDQRPVLVRRLERRRRPVGAVVRRRATREAEAAEPAAVAADVVVLGGDEAHRVLRQRLVDDRGADRVVADERMPPLVSELVVDREAPGTTRAVLEARDPNRAGPLHAAGVGAERHRDDVELRPRVGPVETRQRLEVGGAVAGNGVDVDVRGSGGAHGHLSGLGGRALESAPDREREVAQPDSRFGHGRVPR